MRLFFTLMLIGLLAGSVQAQESSGTTPLAATEKTAARESAETPAAEPEKEAVNPYRQDVHDKAMELAKELSEAEALALAEIRTGFGMIRAVRITRQEVAQAVKECGEANPDMASAMDDRFNQWAGAVDPALAAHEEAMSEAINSGRFKDAEKIESYLDLVDRMAQHADDQIDKKVVTTPEACGALLKSLDETEDALTRILDGLSWPGAADADASESGEKAPENKD